MLPPTAFQEGQRAYWLLKMTWAGRVWRFADSYVEVDGEPYRPALEPPSLADDSQPGSAVSYRSVNIIVYPEEDIAEVISRGYDLRTATATLYRYVDGYDASPEVSGRVTTPEYYPRGGALSFVLEGGPWVQERALPPLAQVVSGTTFDSPDDKALGAPYPYVYGWPGRINQGTTEYRGSPGLVVQSTGNARLMISAGTVDASTVFITDDDVGGWASHSVLHAVDNLGQTYAYVELTALTTPYVAGHSYYVCWGEATVLGRGRVNTITRPIYTARDVLVEILSKTAQGCDVGRTLAAPGLDVELSFYIDEVVDPWAWIKAHLLPILPISIRTGPQGSYPVVWRFRAQKTDASYTLEHQRNAYRMGGIRYPDERAVGEVRLDYAIDAGSGEYLETLTLSGDVLNDGASSTRPARAAWSRGEQGALALKSDVIWDDGSAYTVAASLVERYGIPGRLTTWAVPLSTPVSPGDVVLLIDSEMHLDEQVALVLDNPVVGGYRALTLRLVDW